MKILAIDPATHCGFAHSCGPSGTWDLSIRRDESSGMRLIRFRGKLEEIRQSAGVDLVFFEAVRFFRTGHANAVLVQAEIQGVLKTWCEDNKIEFRGLAPAEIKKFATGKGNANKEAMVKAAQQRWSGKIISDDNEADALWILEFGKASLGITEQTSGPETGANLGAGERKQQSANGRSPRRDASASASSDRQAPLVFGGQQ